MWVIKLLEIDWGSICSAFRRENANDNNNENTTYFSLVPDGCLPVLIRTGNPSLLHKSHVINFLDFVVHGVSECYYELINTTPMHNTMLYTTEPPTHIVSNIVNIV